MNQDGFEPELGTAIASLRPRISGYREDLLRSGTRRAPAAGADGDEEADYCRACAEIEAGMAAIATHPAARAAHLRMAIQYRRRALAALQAKMEQMQDREREGGSLPDSRAAIPSPRRSAA